jgi:hypothetical protein
VNDRVEHLVEIYAAAPENSDATGFGFGATPASAADETKLRTAAPSNASAAFPFGIAPLPGARFDFGGGDAKVACFGATLSERVFNFESPASTGGFNAEATKEKVPSRSNPLVAMPSIVTAPTGRTRTPGDAFRAAFAAPTVASAAECHGAFPNDFGNYEPTPNAFPFGIAPLPGARFDFGGGDAKTPRYTAAAAAAACTPTTSLPAGSGKVNTRTKGNGSKKRRLCDDGNSSSSKQSRPDR